MDIVAHGVWAGIGVVVARRRWLISRRTAAATVALAVVPDLAQLTPLLVLAITSGQFDVLRAYTTALPGGEPALPPLVAELAHHLHCMLHSAVVAGLVTALVRWRYRRVWIPLWGWWSHIVIDLFTHSADYYPVPVLYPFTQRGFDGLAWNTPWFVALNYSAMGAALLLVYLTQPRSSA